MESKHKNALIVALVAVVLVMAVGYAAFAQNLIINGSAEITSTWDVHMTQDNTQVTSNAGNALATDPEGTVTVGAGGAGATGTSATFTANLVSPGDTVTFVVPIVNTGTINAKLNTIKLTSVIPDMQIDNGALTATTQDGNIKFTVTSPGATVLSATNGQATVTVKAEYVSLPGGNTNAQNQSASLTVTMDYVQA